MNAVGAPDDAPERGYPPRHPAVAFAVALIFNFVGPSTFNVLPLLSAGATSTLGFSERQAGVMSFAISVGSGVSALLSGLWVRSAPWPRAAALSLGGMSLAYVLAMFVHNYVVFVLLQGVAGFCGSAALCLAVTILSDRPDSSRSFGIAFAMQTAYQVAALWAGPTLLRLGGLNGVLILLAASSGLAMLFAPLLPRSGARIAPKHQPKFLLGPAALLALIGCGAYFVNAGAYWTYIELIGLAHGMSSRVVGNCVALGVSAGVLGGVLAGVLGNRFGDLWPLVLSTLLTLVAALLLNGPMTTVIFTLSVILYYFAWNYSLAYQLSIVNAVDSTGRGVAMTGAFGYLGASAGAAVAALFVTPHDYTVVTWVAIIASCLSTALFAVSQAVHAGRRQAI